MKPIIAPINREQPRENRATEVTNLQDGVLLLLGKGVIRVDRHAANSQHVKD